MKKLFLLMLLCLAPLAARADSSAAQTPAAMPPQAIADLSRIEAYLNGLKNISADFLQVDDAGGIMRGEIAISRPGKMKVTYNTNKDFIIADGSFVHIWDDQLQSQTNVEQGTSLAEFILRDPVRLHGEVTVTKFRKWPTKLEVTLVQTDDPGAGSLTLVFEDKPLKLRQWKVIDPQGHETGVNLENMSEGMVFPSSTFVFVPPTFDKTSK